mmetsp:Transcript_37349/g.76622  ORF Transcript_37349/g.76622 Transcript_37349/m.76622 type:complete len:1929 (+) Transcript_37349:134-5920(+)|eukprot:CAMPEP_0181300606 /NCGR_PEP_ID=MMETSP1101-20121128/6978_1 /TAXON_ID=46948 /ORGANISM="Rhodomonas abbreviata, Strain Caron Lab Isolate" /LENGTH=1928 /DNA_ID=CAMNT_0023405851 /DNA_START=133 /DNA_END=5919 /DNA_ORIENTATION=+
MYGRRIARSVCTGLVGRQNVLGKISARQMSDALRGRTTPFGPYGGLRVEEESAKQGQERLDSLGVTGEGTPLYEQFIKDRVARRTKFLAENKTLVNLSHDIELIKDSTMSCIDGNQAAAHIAYALSDVSFIYPITPSSAMGEMVDEWASRGLKNCFGQTVSVTEMQSEGGAAGALHGTLKAGALASSYTASQGLLLMIPNMYKIAGELLPCVLHVSARTLCAHALNIFGDHSDVMSARSTGWVMLCSESTQMTMDQALVSHLTTMEARIPVMHFFDGFRTSHEVNKVKMISYKDISGLIPWDAVKKHHDSALSPSNPHIQGTNQGPDVFFQGQEASNKFHAAVPAILEKYSDKVHEITGRRYGMFAYDGHPEAEEVVVVMGSGAVTISETVHYLTEKLGKKVGVIKVRLFRPWVQEKFLAALPASVKRIAVLDRCKDVGAQGEPLYLDVCTTLFQSGMSDIQVIGGRFGLGGKDFTPGMALAVYENLAAPEPKPEFTVGITDDVTHLSLPMHDEIDILPEGTIQCLLYGLGSDGTVGANKTAIKLIAKNTENDAQGYFEYDAKKSGGLTVSHLRFGPKQIKAPYLVKNANYIGIHKESYIHRYDMCKNLKKDGIVALNCTFSPEEADKYIPDRMKAQLAAKNAKLYLINGVKVGQETGMGKRINMVMQSVFFKLSGVMPFDEAIALLKKDIVAMYGKKGDKVVAKNHEAVDKTLENLVEVKIPASWAKANPAPPARAPRQQARAYSTSASAGNASSSGVGMWRSNAPGRSPLANRSGVRYMSTVREIKQRTLDFVHEIVEPVNNQEGNDLPVSAFQPGGRVPTGTSASEKRGIALQVPRVDMDKCTQCNYCSLICPHAAVRPFLFTNQEIDAAPAGIKEGSRKAIGGGALDKYNFRIQVSPYDCTGCELCVRICPADALTFEDTETAIATQGDNWKWAIDQPVHGEEIDKTTVKGSQFQQPLLEFSGACEGCGETPYVKLLTQLLGERLVVANATGCSSIWGASNPSFPYTTNSRGEGPAWANSLFEDNAEFGLGMRRAFKQRRDQLMLQVDEALEDKEVSISDKLRKLLTQFSVMRHEDKADMLLPKGRSFYNQLKDKIIPLLQDEAKSHPKLQRLYDQRDIFGRNSHWIIGGDGWAYDIGFGGLDHVLASEEHVHVLVLDTEMYSNTGGQASKSTPRGALAKFAEAGKLTAKKDLGQYAMTYKNVYVASICIHVNHQQAVRAFLEAEAFPGPSLVICYSPCISQGFPMAESINHCREAVESGYWPLYRYNPLLKESGNNPFQLDSKKVTGDLFKFLAHENRFAAVMRRDPKHAEMHQQRLEKQIGERAKALNVLSMDELPSSMNAAAPSDSVTILYGSETGNAEEQAKSLFADVKARGLHASIATLDDFEFSELAEQTTVVVVISTCGQGEFPANSHKFWKALQDPTLPMSLLDGVKFTVFGLGDSTYSLFCVAAEAIDVRMAELGGTRILNRGIGDDRDEDRFYTGWDDWTPQLWNALHAPAKPLVREIPKPAFQIDKTAGDAEPSVNIDSIVPVGSVPLELMENTLLTPEGYDRDIRHYVFKIKDTGVSYECGDVLAIWPRNHQDQVDEFCKMYGLNPTDELRVMSLPDARNPIPEELNIRQLFTSVLDIFGKPNRRFFDSLALYATDEAEKAKLELITSEDPAGKMLYRELTNDMVHHADVFGMFPSARPPLEQLMNMIPVIKPRSYSIASAPLMHPDEIELCIVAVDWEVPSRKETRFGQTTSYLIKQKVGATIMCSVKPSSIVLPEDHTVPILMAGMGTGLAPWRALTQHRIVQKQQGLDVGPCVIYYGARKAATEYIYREEFEKYEKMGVLTMRTAFSRDQARKIYVQNRIAEDYDNVYRQMMEENGAFFVCGSSRNVPEDIYNAMKEVMMKGGKMDEAHAEAALSSLKMDGRYTVEAWS